MSTNDSRLDLLPDRLAALHDFLETGDTDHLRNTLYATPDDYEPQVDEMRVLAAHILGVAPERVSRPTRLAVKHALWVLAGTERDDVIDESGYLEVTPRMALVELLRSLRSRPGEDPATTTWGGDSPELCRQRLDCFQRRG